MVVLSEANLLANIEGSLDIFGPKESDILLGILPPFHSFGFTLNTLLPLLSGLRATYSPNPTDGSTIRGHLKASSATILCGTPSFLRSILGPIKSEDHHLRILASGAEKCPKELMEMIQARAPKATLCEGYGITECSPVISMNPPNAPRPGTVGVPLRNLQVRIEPIDGG